MAGNKKYVSVLNDGTQDLYLHAEKADVLVGKEKEDTATYTLRSAGGKTNNVDNDIESGLATLKSIDGNGIAWNQLCTNGNFESKSGWYGQTFDIADNIASRTPSAAYTYVQKERPGIPGHVYYISAEHKADSNVREPTLGIKASSSSVLGDISTTNWQKWSTIAPCTNTTILIFVLRQGAALETYTKLYARNIQLIDLSLIYGLGNEPTSVEQVEADLAKLIAQKPYYQYNAGELYGTKKLHIVSYGQNLFNPNTKKTRLAPYKYGTNGDNKYGIAFQNGATAATNGITFTPDATGVAETITPDANGIFSIPSAGTLQVTMASGSSASDVYVWAVWDGKKNGIENFVPFSQDALEIKVSEIYGKNSTGEYVKVFEDDVMRGAGNVHDAIDLQAMTADVNVGSVDFGSKRWIAEAVGGNSIRMNVDDFLSLGIKLPPTINDAMNAICTKYSVLSYYVGADAPYTVFVSWETAGTKGLWLKDTSKGQSVPTAQDPWLNGVYLWFELTTPAHYTDLKLSSDGQTFRDLPKSFAVDNWGIEEQLPNDATIPTGKDFTGVAAQVTTVYQQNVGESIESLPMEYASLVDFQKKADKAAPYTEGNVAILSKQGNYADSGVALGDLLDTKVKVNSSFDNEFYPVLACAEDTPTSGTAYEAVYSTLKINPSFGSVAEGNNTTATGSYSHTEGGSTTTANGPYAHAEGYTTEASNDSAHAEGRFSKAKGMGSHAEGVYTKADGNYSHAEGIGDDASPYQITVTILSARAKAALLDLTGIEFTYGSNSYNIQPCTIYSDSGCTQKVGEISIVKNISGFSEGSMFFNMLDTQIQAGTYYFKREAKAGGDYSHSEGEMTKAIVQSSHAEGKETTTSGLYSHAEGNTSQAKGTASHAEGGRTLAKGSYAHAEGFNTSASGESSHAEGWETKSFGQYAHAQGERTYAVGQSAHAEGVGDDESRHYYNDTGLTVVSGYSSKPNAVALNKSPYDKLSIGDTIFYNNSHYVINNMSSGPYVIWADGLSYSASATDAKVYKVTNNDVTIAEGKGSHAEGHNTYAKGNYSHTSGEGTIAAADAQVAIGKYNVEDTNGAYAFIIGNGSSKSARKNGFAIKPNGTIVVTDYETDTNNPVTVELTPKKLRELLELLAQDDLDE